MKEFMLLIRATGNPISTLSFSDQKKHIDKIGKFITSLHERGVLKTAQPFKVEGVMLSTKDGEMMEEPFEESDDMLVGYYHIEVESMDEALEIARSDPRFVDSDWTIELRPIMTLDL